jgi:hypothetical protein
MDWLARCILQGAPHFAARDLGFQPADPRLPTPAGHFLARDSAKSVENGPATTYARIVSSGTPLALTEIRGRR